jgi:hypothetical protein
MASPKSTSKILKPAAALAAVLLAVACNMEALKKAEDKGGGQAHTSDFAGKGTLCGTFTSFHGFTDAKKTASGRPFNLMVQLGVCGKMGEKEWKALAVSQTADEVTVVDGNASAKSKVYLDDKSVFVKAPNGKPAQIGTVANSSEASPIKVSEGVTVQVMVDGEPFSLEQHSKSSTGKSVQITLD